MKNYLVIRVVILFLFYNTKVEAQWGNQWVLGNNKGLDFNNLGLPQPWEPNSLVGLQGNSIICDNNGQVILYTDGEFCYNKLHQQMPNGFDLGAQNTSQSQNSVLLPHPDGSDRYFIVAVDECYELFDTTFCSSLGNYGGVIWALVDMNLEGGLGDVVVKQQHLYYPTCSKITATRHCNGVDWWVVTKEYNTNRFFTYLVTTTGINPVPIISSIGLINPFNYALNWGWGAKRGQMKISSKGNLLGVKSNSPCFVQLFRFDNQTGLIFDQLYTDYFDTLNPDLPNPVSNYGEGLSFSPDDKKLYINFGSFALNLIQYDLSTLDSAYIMNSKINVLQNSPIGWRSVANLQIGPDQKLYFHLQDSMYRHKLSWLDEPNKLGLACNPSYTYLSHTNDTVYYAVFTPNIIDCIYARHHLGAILMPNCTGVLDSLFFTDTLMNVVHSFIWDFGDPASGFNNTSTEHFPTHNFTSPGIYTVTLTVQNDCDGYTVTQQVNIGSNVPVVPTINVNGISLQSSNAISYQWFLNNNAIAGATNQLYTPLQSGYYSVLVTDSNGCMVQSLELYFVLTSNNAQVLNKTISVLPNPADQSISLVTKDVLSNIIISDLAGKIVTQSTSSINIDISFLNSGIYFIQAKSGEELMRTKFIKN